MTQKKRNCWEHTKCGREPGGANVDKLGVCPTTLTSELDGVHGGTNAGRCCWTMEGTMCGGKTVHGAFASKSLECMKCEFYRDVTREEGDGLEDAYEILTKHRRKSE